MKKFISIMLTVVMIVSIMLPSVSAATEASKVTPVVVVRGIDFAGLTYSDGTKALQVNGSDIMGLLWKGFWGSLNLQGEETVADGIFEVAKGIFLPIACDKEGNSLDPNVSMVQYRGSMAEHMDKVYALGDGGEEGIVKTAVEKYGAENVYFFTYDWRKAPEQLAAELNEYIETAKANSGVDKVNIVCASMGGMVTTAYMYYYGYDSINSAVYLSGAQNGTYVCGDALNGRIVFESDVLVSLVNSVAGDNMMLRVFMYIFNALGVMDFITFVANDTVATSFDRANDVMLRDCLGTMCGFWALCPDEDFDTALETIFGGHEDEYPVLMEKLAGVRSFVMSTEDTLKGAMESGVKLSFVSNYNIGLVPVYERANLNGDMVLESELTSNFATIAPLGETLSQEYLANADRQFVSDDRVIDSSTAVFRDNTWFVKDAPHVAADYGTGFSDFTFTLLESDVQPTIYTFPQYPQFLIADGALNVTEL